MSKIVVGVDDSGRSGAALEFALEEGRARALPVVAVLAEPRLPLQPDSDVERAARDTVAAAYARVLEARPELAAVPFSIEIHRGAPAEVLAVASVGSDLLVLGGRRHAAVAHAVLGSASAALVRHAGVPVAVVHEPDRGVTAHTRRIMVGVDGTPESEAALKWAVAEAEVRGLSVVAVRAFDVTPTIFPDLVIANPRRATWHARQMEVEAETADFVRDAVGGCGVPIQVRSAAGPAPDVLVALARADDLIVVGGRRLTSLERLFLGSTTTAVLHKHHGPMVVVHVAPTAGTAPAAQSSATTVS